MNRQRVLSLRSGLLWALALGLGALGCGGQSAKPAAERPAGPAVDTRTAEVVRSGGGSERMLPGSVAARERAALSARVPASVAELPYREGQRVAAGAVVVRLDDAALRSGVDAAETALKAAETDLARMQALLKKGAATPREVEETATRAAGARAHLSTAKDQVSYAVLRAPFAGIVAARPANLGDVATPGRTLIEIEGDAGLEVRASVESDVVGSLQPGLRLKALVDGQPQALESVVRVVSSAGDPTTYRFEVRADLPATSGLRSGLFARLVLPQASGEPRLMVPKAAVFRRGGLEGVFVVTDGRARLRWVAPGETTGELVHIRAGVTAGERVALDHAALSDGAAVRETR